MHVDSAMVMFGAELCKFVFLRQALALHCEFACSLCFLRVCYPNQGWCLSPLIKLVLLTSGRALRSSHVIIAQAHTDLGASIANFHSMHPAEQTQIHLPTVLQWTAGPDRDRNQQTPALVPAAVGPEQPTGSTPLPPL